MGAREDDTTLDALAVLAKTRPELSGEAAERLLVAARAGDTAARERLVAHSLGWVLDQAVGHRDHGIEVVDLFQEGSLAATIAIDQYVERGGSGARLGGYVRRVVSDHLDRAVEREEAASAEAAAIIADTRLLEAALTATRQRSGREPTETELAALLQWAPERVELIADVLGAAGEQFDADLVQYLDSEDNEPE